MILSFGRRRECWNLDRADTTILELNEIPIKLFSVMVCANRESDYVPGISLESPDFRCPSPALGAPGKITHADGSSGIRLFMCKVCDFYAIWATTPCNEITDTECHGFII
jgi:hypothetical protein